MNLKLSAMVIGLALAAAACDPAAQNTTTSSSAASKPPPTLEERMTSQAQPAAPDASAAASDARRSNPAESSAASSPEIPDGAQYTLFCLNINTPAHVADANRVKSALMKRTRSQDWYVIHEEDKSTIYYGYYKTYNDPNQPAEVRRAQLDRKTLTEMKDDNGDTPFNACCFVPLNSPDPAAPPEWDVTRAPGYFALQIAAFRGIPDRKQRAIEAVREARAQGVKAYYYHGSVISSVLIGTWPREALTEQDANDARPAEAGKAVMVVPQELPRGTRTDNLFTSEGNQFKVMTQKVEVVDPTLIKAMNDYPTNAVNGQDTFRNVKTDQGVVKAADPSFIVVIPRKEGDEGPVNADAAPGNAEPAPVNPGAAPGNADAPPERATPGADAGRGRGPAAQQPSPSGPQGPWATPANTPPGRLRPNGG